jgi:hypothetical protein
VSLCGSSFGKGLRPSAVRRGHITSACALQIGHGNVAAPSGTPSRPWVPPLQIVSRLMRGVEGQSLRGQRVRCCTKQHRQPEIDVVFVATGRIFMPRPASPSNRETASDRDDSARMAGTGAEPELGFVNRDSVAEPPDSNLSHSTYFQGWHQPYVEALEALLDSDPGAVHQAIIRAQRAILNRYLELAAASESAQEEAEDLATAVEVLQTMKRQTRTPVC